MSEEYWLASISMEDEHGNTIPVIEEEVASAIAGAFNAKVVDIDEDGSENLKNNGCWGVCLPFPIPLGGGISLRDDCGGCIEVEA